MKKIKLLIIFLLIFHCNVYGQSLIDLNKIKQIESSGNTLAYNKQSGARGLYQITNICLLEYNNFHKEKYCLKDLFSAEINEKIAKWYLEVRIPQMLKYYKKEVNIENIIWCYNSGVGNLLKNIMPKETKEYMVKYEKIATY